MSTPPPQDQPGLPGHPPQPPPAAPPAGAPRPSGTDSFFDSLRRSGIARANDRWIGGVAAGIAHRLGVDPLVVRGILVVLTLFGGLTLVLYGLAWALLPEASDGRIHLQEAIRGRFDAALAGAAAFVVLGLTRPVFWFDPDRWAPGWLIAVAWLGLLATIAVVAVVAANSGRRTGGGPPLGAGSAGPQAAPPFARAPVPPPTAGPPLADNQKTPPDQTGTAMPSPAHPGTAAPGSPASYPSDTPAPYGPTSAPSTPYGPPPADGPAPYGGPGGGGQYQPPGAPPAAGTVERSWQPPAPRPRPEGPGAVTVGIVLALCFFAGAAVLVAHRTGALDGSAALTVAGAALALLGLGVLISGARGRRSGVLGGLAVLVALLAVPAAAIASATPGLNRIVSSGGNVIAGDVLWAPTSVSDAERGYGYGVGSARIDLTRVPLPESGSAAVEVPVDAGIGSTTVVVPTGVPLEVRTHLAAGEIRSSLSGDWTRPLAAVSRRTDADSATGTLVTLTESLRRTELSGTNLNLVLRSPQAGDLALIVTIDAGFGDVTIEESLR